MTSNRKHCRAITRTPHVAQTALALKLDSYLTIITNLFIGGLGLWSSTTMGWWGAWLDIIGGEFFDVVFDDEEEDGGDGGDGDEG